MAYQMIPSVKPNKQKGERFLKCKFELEIVFWRKSFERPSQSGKMGVLSKQWMEKSFTCSRRLNSFQVKESICENIFKM